jgi:phosphoadenosine phosphosulfate reductase
MAAVSEPEVLDLDAKNLALERATPQEILQWAVEQFRGSLCMSTSFQLGGMVLIDMLSKIDPSLPTLFVDTSFHFKETLEFRDAVVARYKVNLITVKSDMTRDEFVQFYGDDRLYERNPNECCRVNKIEPMEQALKGYGARIQALRRDAGSDRAKIRIVERRTDGVYLIHPLANWTRDQLKAYLTEHVVLQHPLHAKGYKTIGCSPECCTKPVGEHAPERAGRWTGTGKTECGLHQIGMRKPPQDFAI